MKAPCPHPLCDNPACPYPRRQDERSNTWVWFLVGLLIVATWVAALTWNDVESVEKVVGAPQ